MFRIPAEELFFFIIQTYNTSLLYILVTKFTLFPIYLRPKSRDKWISWRLLGQSILGGAIAGGAYLVNLGSEGTYLGMILVWAGPVLLMLWTLAYQFLLGLPLSQTLLPIAVPTLYLWIVDTVALRRGTWAIESGTKLNIQVWEGLEVEEALFFLVTNALVVFGLVAFDNAVAVLEAFPRLFPTLPSLPSPILLVKALLTPTTSYDGDRIQGLTDAVRILQRKSRSFYLASGVFQGRLRMDLILLYSFCRIADDLIDNAKDAAEAEYWVARFTDYLNDHGPSKLIHGYGHTDEFPEYTHSTLRLLPSAYIPSEPLFALMEGFRMDIEYPKGNFPIKLDKDLQLYASRVAGTVAEMCLHLVYHHHQELVDDTTRRRCLAAGGRMGIALQYTNIARDILTDAADGRVYIPTAWLEELDLSPQDIVRAKGRLPEASQLRRRLLDAAMKIYGEARIAIEELPTEVVGPMRVAVESYIEIARVLLRSGDRMEFSGGGKAGRATVSRARRLWVGWKALQGPREPLERRETDYSY